MVKKAKIKSGDGGKWYDFTIRYLLYSLVVLIPVAFSPAFYTTFSAPKLFILRGVTLAIILLWGFKTFVEQSFSWKKSRLNIYLLVYGIVTLITTVFSVAVYSSLYGAQGRFLGFFTIINLLLLPFFVWNFLNDKEEIVRLLKISVFTSSVLAVYGILQHFGIWQEGFNWNQDPADRVFGTIGHGNHFGAYLGMNLVIGVFLFKNLKQNLWRWLLAAGLVFHTVTIFLTASRGAIGAILVALIICTIILAVRFSKKRLFDAGRLVLPLFITVAVLFTAAIVWWDDIAKFPLIERTSSTIESIRAGKVPDRVSWWMSAVEMIKEKPLLGSGLSTFRDEYNRFRRLDYETVEEGDQEAHITPEAAHNEYLNIAATQGLIGLAAFLAIIVFVFWRADKVLFSKREEAYYYELLGVKGALMVYLVQVLMSFGVISTLVIFYLLLGAALVLSESGAGQCKYRLFCAGKYLCAVLVIFVVGLASIGAAREALAEIYYKNALLAAAEGNLDDAFDNYAMMIAAKPEEYEYLQAAGDFALQASLPVSAITTKLDLLEMAVKNYQRAIAINPHHPSTFYNMGIAQFQMYAMTGQESYYIYGRQNLELAVEKSPNNPLYPYQVAKAFLGLGTKDSKNIALSYLRDALNIRNPYRDAGSLIENIISEQ